jgi:hypothetical protein
VLSVLAWMVRVILKEHVVLNLIINLVLRYIQIPALPRTIDS